MHFIDIARKVLGRLLGTPGYESGTAGATVNVPARGAVLTVSGYANGADGTITIDGGDPITVRSGAGYDESFLGSLTAGADGTMPIVFSASMDYYVSWVIPAQ